MTTIEENEQSADLRHGTQTQRPHCPDCGLGVHVDEDGCCISCGHDAMYYGTEHLEAEVRSLRASLAAAHADLARYAAVVVAASDPTVWFGHVVNCASNTGLGAECAPPYNCDCAKGRLRAALDAKAGS